MDMAANDTAMIWSQDPPKVMEEDLREALLWAFDRDASDITLMTDEPMLMRLHGEWRRVSTRRLTTPEILELLSATYAPNAPSLLAGGDALDYSYRIVRSRTEEVRFRCNATSGQTAFAGHAGLGVVFRAISSVPPSVEDLEIEPDLLAVHRDIARSQGLCLVVGATGTGKSTLLASLMRDVLTTPPSRMIITYEAPIEFNLSATPDKCGVVIQTEVPRHQPSFGQGVSNALRRAPDIIMVGEARDKETIAGAVAAGMTGHAVYTTLHASSVAAALPRLIAEFPPNEHRSILSRVLDVARLIVTQRLVPAANGHGRVALREFLALDNEARMELAHCDLDRIQPTLHRLVAERGQSILMDARAKHQRGAIGEETLRLIEAEWASPPS